MSASGLKNSDLTAKPAADHRLPGKTPPSTTQTEIVRNGARVDLLTGAYNDRENAALLARYIREKSGIPAEVVPA